MTDPAYERNGQPCTRTAFYALACDPARSVAVEACAGAGKTWMLVSRIVRALLAGTQPQEILAITFTRKAAGEMRARLQDWLLDFSQPRPADPAQGKAAETTAEWQGRLEQELTLRGIAETAAPALREPLAALYGRVLASGEAVQIRTFHSWFITLLRGAPLAVLRQLGLPLQYELQPDAKREIAEVWRPFLRAVQADAALRADYEALVQTVGRFNLHKALENALARRMDFALADGAGAVADAVAPFAHQFPRFAGLDDPADALDGDIARQRWLERSRALGQEKNKTPQKAAAAVVEAFEKTAGDGRLQALRKAFFVAAEDRLTNNLQNYPAAQEAADELLEPLRASRQHAAALYHQRMTRLVRTLLQVFGDLKRERGWVDMDDVEHAALTLLADHELSAWVQEKLDLRVRQLLVDEFQDTNALQWRALHAWLAGYAGAGGGPNALRVFLVGDPKQSIYRFRRADPRLFNAAQDFIVQALGGDRLACDHTWRNAPEVLATVNRVMEQAQEKGEFAGFRTHTTESESTGEIAALPMIPRPPKVEKTGADAEEPLAWRDSLHDPREEPDETLRTLECRQVAHWIAARVAAGVAPARIMVLARKREPLSVLQLELRACGVPAEYDTPQMLTDLPVVQDVLALVDGLLSPGNDLMLARALKSPFFAVTDAQLAAIAQAARAAPDGAAAWLDVLPIVAWPDGDAAVLHARLIRYRSWLLQLPPHDALQAIYADTDAPARFAAASPAADRDHALRQLDAVLGSALDVDGGRFLTSYRWLHTLRRGRTPAPAGTAHDSVRLLTVHGAKGLEADEVILLDAAVGAGGRRGEPAMLVDWPAGDPAPTRLAFVAKDTAPSEDVEDLMQAERQAAAREELNALYVALTRARNRLVLAAFEPGTQVDDSWWLRVGADQGVVAMQAVPDAAPPPATIDSAEAYAWMALPPAADLGASAVNPLPPEGAGDDTDARVGQAMHWLLEHATVDESDQTPAQQRLAALRFGLDAEGAQRAVHMAAAIRHGEGAWAWSPEQIAEAFNEIPLTHDGQSLRMDRLVHRRATESEPETWWVLDYKSAHRPERNAELRQQLATYRAAVRALFPGQSVKAAFLDGDGHLTQLDKA